MEPQKPSLGESVGSLVASLVDAALSHCEAHKGATAGTGTQPGVISGKVDPDPVILDPDEEISWSVGVKLGCAPGSTGVPGETMVNLSVPTSYPNGVTLGPAKVTSLPPGMAVPTSSHPATAPTHAAPGSNTLRVSIDPALPRGLYLGELRAVAATTSGGPRCPVVIFLDGLP